MKCDISSWFSVFGFLLLRQTLKKVKAKIEEGVHILSFHPSSFNSVTIKFTVNTYCNMHDNTKSWILLLEMKVIKYMYTSQI